MTTEPDTYNAADNAYGCWKLAIRSMRLDEIRAGRATPRPDDPEEMEVVENEPRRTYFFSGGHWHWTTGSAPKRSVETDDKAPATNEGDEGFKTSDDV